MRRTVEPLTLPERSFRKIRNTSDFFANQLFSLRYDPFALLSFNPQQFASSLSGDRGHEQASARSASV
jgi:hypothetical protein